MPLLIVDYLMVLDDVTHDVCSGSMTWTGAILLPTNEEGGELRRILLILLGGVSLNVRTLPTRPNRFKPAFFPRLEQGNRKGLTLKTAHADQGGQP
jgi:hypothetical protein